MYMRFVRLKVKEGKHWESARYYEDRVIQAMQETEGCLFASLLQPSGDEDESGSVGRIADASGEYGIEAIDAGLEAIEHACATCRGASHLPRAPCCLDWPVG